MKKTKTPQSPLYVSDELSENPELISRMGQHFLEMILNYWDTSSTEQVLPLACPDDFRHLSRQSFPTTGISLEEILAEISQWIQPGLTRTASPRYLGMMNPSPALVAVFTESLAAAFNQNCSLWHQSPGGAEIEKTVVQWLCEVVGLKGKTPFGTLVSGGSIANITALKLARSMAIDGNIRDAGLYHQPPLCVYVSDQAHYSFEKAMDFLGMGTRYLRLAPTDLLFQVIPDRLEAMIQKDLRKGYTPFCVVGIAGTTNTGTVDPLDELAKIARKYNLWFHVDAAYGGAAALLPELDGLYKGMSDADSITLDPHKWFFIPYEGAAILVRDSQRLQSEFSIRPSYYLEQGDSDESKINFYEFGLQGSRSFKALKIWTTFKFFGLDFYQKVIRRNIGFASCFHDLLLETGEFEVFHQPVLGILCFRASPTRWRSLGTVTPKVLNDLNRRIHRRLEKEGRFWLSITRVTDQDLALRVNFENYRTTEAHVRELSSYLLHLLNEEV